MLNTQPTGTVISGRYTLQSSLIRERERERERGGGSGPDQSVKTSVSPHCSCLSSFWRSQCRLEIGSINPTLYQGCTVEVGRIVVNNLPYSKSRVRDRERERERERRGIRVRERPGRPSQRKIDSVKTSVSRTVFVCLCSGDQSEE